MKPPDEGTWSVKAGEWMEQRDAAREKLGAARTVLSDLVDLLQEVDSELLGPQADFAERNALRMRVVQAELAVRRFLADFTGAKNG
jgi:hypothetical protein